MPGVKPLARFAATAERRPHGRSFPAPPPTAPWPRRTRRATALQAPSIGHVHVTFVTAAYTSRLVTGCPARSAPSAFMAAKACNRCDELSTRERVPRRAGLPAPSLAEKPAGAVTDVQATCGAATVCEWARVDGHAPAVEANRGGGAGGVTFCGAVSSSVWRSRWHEVVRKMLWFWVADMPA